MPLAAQALALLDRRRLQFLLKLLLLLELLLLAMYVAPSCGIRNLIVGGVVSAGGGGAEAATVKRNAEVEIPTTAPVCLLIASTRAKIANDPGVEVSISAPSAIGEPSIVALQSVMTFQPPSHEKSTATIESSAYSMKKVGLGEATATVGNLMGWSDCAGSGVPIPIAASATTGRTSEETPRRTLLAKGIVGPPRAPGRGTLTSPSDYLFRGVHAAD